MSSSLGLERWVAVVDDDESLRRSLARFLRAHGILVRTFESAQEYLSSAPGTAPACIVLDVYLRDAMTGLELGEHLRAQGASTPIIFITAQDEHELASSGADATSGAFLRKPFDPVALLDLVVQRVGGDRTHVA